MNKDLMIYLHVPFCVRKCNYCDFLSGARDAEKRALYVECLAREIRERGKEYSGRNVTSVFFGGGTPSLLSHAQIFEIMKALRETFHVSNDAEITMECNPGTVGGADAKEEGDKLAGYVKAGINRLSIGLQSANDSELRTLGRIHDYEAFLRTWQLAREAGFKNVNVDLMNALPGQTMDSWKDTLERVLSLEPVPEHLSVYSLILEEGTLFWDWEKNGRFTGKLQIPSEDLDREMYAYTGARLRDAGFEQYEISNYARKGYLCRHNFGYWTRREYLGLGLGAASLLAEVRYANETDLEKYLADPLAGRTQQKLSRKDQMEEFLFLGLRTCRGVFRKEFRECFGEELDALWSDVIGKNVRDGLIEDDGCAIRLTARGMDLGNYVSAQFLLDE